MEKMSCFPVGESVQTKDSVWKSKSSEDGRSSQWQLAGPECSIHGKTVLNSTFLCEL